MSLLQTFLDWRDPLALFANPEPDQRARFNELVNSVEKGIEESLPDNLRKRWVQSANPPHIPKILGVKTFQELLSCIGYNLNESRATLTHDILSKYSSSWVNPSNKDIIVAGLMDKYSVIACSLLLPREHTQEDTQVLSYLREKHGLYMTPDSNSLEWLQVLTSPYLYWRWWQTLITQRRPPNLSFAFGQFEEPGRLNWG